VTKQVTSEIPGGVSPPGLGQGDSKLNVNS